MGNSAQESQEAVVEYKELDKITTEAEQRLVLTKQCNLDIPIQVF